VEEKKEELIIKECPHCKSTKFVKNGHYKNIQRFRCPECHKTFRNKDYPNLTQADIVLLSALINLMDTKIPTTNKRYNIKKVKDILEIMKSTTLNIESLNKVKFSLKSYTREELFGFKSMFGKSNVYKRPEISCYKPLLILCHDHKDMIRIIKLEEFDFSGYVPYELKNFRREIKLIIRPR